MSLVYTLKLICDLFFYLTFAGLISSILTGNGLLAAVPFLLGCAVLAGIFHNKNRLKYLSLILLLPPLYIVRENILNYMFLLPACAYCVYYISILPFEITRMEYADIFNLFLKIAPITAILALAAARTHLESVAIPYAAVFILTSITLMRMLRHDRDILNQNKFKLINSLSVASIFLLGTFVSSKFFTDILAAISKFIYFNLIAPIITLLLTIFIYLLWPLISLIDFNKKVEIYEQENAAISAVELFKDEIIPETGIGYVFFQVIVYAILIAIGCFLLYKLFKKFTKIYATGTNASISEERIFLEGSYEKKQSFVSDNQIRRIYKKFLQLCEKRGIVFYPSTTTKDIAYSAGNLFGDSQKTTDIREIYIKTRYGERSATKEEIKECRGIYNTLKKKEMY